MLKIFNTLTRKKEKFCCVTKKNIKIYVCGITAYDLCHIGHARTFIIFDTVIRYLKYCGYYVDYTRNITDIDDKIIKKAQKNNENITELTNRMIKEMHLDLDKLDILRPNYEPRVTEYIDTIINSINLLIKKKHAYVTIYGDVMFSIDTVNNYGALSNYKICSSYDKYNIKYNIKRNSADFALWKSTKPGEPCWKAPWGLGRPGWHIECSVMSYLTLGKYLDIHGGGSDLIFPHHENEIIQSIYAYNIPCAKVWMHSGMVLLNNFKMSKSSNNYLTIRSLLQDYDAETIRYFLMSAHYRNQLKFDLDNIQNARKSLERLYVALLDTNPNIIEPVKSEYFISKFISKMNDDFNTPEAYAVLFELAHQLNYFKNKNHPLTQNTASTLKYLGNIIGLLNQNPKVFLKKLVSKSKKSFSIEIIQELIENREKARQAGLWELSDKIRKKLAAMGILLEDEKTGKTKWRYY